MHEGIATALWMWLDYDSQHALLLGWLGLEGVEESHSFPGVRLKNIRWRINLVEFLSCHGPKPGSLLSGRDGSCNVIQEGCVPGWWGKLAWSISGHPLCVRYFHQAILDHRSKSSGSKNASNSPRSSSFLSKTLRRIFVGGF